jgi:hypothetical protein
MDKRERDPLLVCFVSLAFVYPSLSLHAPEKHSNYLTVLVYEYCEGRNQVPESRKGGRIINCYHMEHRFV